MGWERDRGIERTLMMVSLIRVYTSGSFKSIPVVFPYLRTTS